MRIHSTIYVVLFLFSSPIFAQYLSNNGNFRVDQIKGCAPLTVNFTNLKGGGACGSSPCNVKFEVTNTITDCANAYVASSFPSVQNPSSPFPYTFTQPGTYRIITLYEGDCDQITITVTPSLQPEFDLYSCSGNQVQVDITDTNYDSYFINYNDGSPEVQVPKGSLAKDQHAFASSGSKTVSVRGKDVNAADNCSSNSKTFNAVVALTAPVINTLVVNDNGTDIDLTFTNDLNVLYRLEVGVNSSTNFQLLKTIHDVASTTVSNLRTDDNYYCFRLGAYDPCSGTTTYSNTICSPNFDAVAENNQNRLTWLTSTPAGTVFNISRDGLPHAGTSNKTFIDAPITCNQTYVYRLTWTYANGSTSTSSTKSVTSFTSDTPTPIVNVTAVVNSTSVDLTWQTDPAFTPEEYSVFKKSGGGSLNFKGTVTSTSYTDDSYAAEDQSCYRINYVDACGNSSAQGMDVCPIQLTATLTGNNDVSLTWSDYGGWINGVASYVIEKYDDQGNLIATIPVSTATSYVDGSVDPNEQVYLYVVKANAVDAGLGQSVSNQVLIIKKPIIKFPTAFTPDGMGDVRNERFMMACCTLYVQSYDLKIFNRWGELIFTTTTIDDGWDGTYNGKSQPEGTYAFIANVRDLIGKTYTRSGSVVLLRKK